MTAKGVPSIATYLRVRRPALVFLTVVITITLVALTVRAWRLKPSVPVRRDSAAITQAPLARSNSYVKPGRLTSKLSFTLNMLGDRLVRPGKERLTLVGTLRRQKDSQAIPFRLFLELPRQMRLEEQGNSARVTIFDGSNGVTQDAPLSEVDRNTIETLVFDSVDGFFFGQMQGNATRALGSRFRLDNGETSNYTGPFYDIYQVSDPVNIGSTARLQPKRFYFNSDTLLLERVRYQIERSGKPVKVEIQISGWQRSNGQQIQRSITRLEDDVPVLTMAITSVTVSQRQNDSIFRLP